MAFAREKEKAKALRKTGMSLNEIAAATGMKKSTISFWCRDVSLSPIQLRRLIEKQRERGNIGLVKSAQLKRQMRLKMTSEAKQLGAQDIGKLSDRDLLILGMGLYWGEGYKNVNGEFGFTNSDPRIIKVFVLWIERIYKIKKRDLILRVSINRFYRAKTSEIIRYWSSVTNVPSSQFTQTSLIKTPVRKVYANDKEYVGTLRIKVRRGTALLRRVLGSIEHVASVLS